MCYLVHKTEVEAEKKRITIIEAFMTLPFLVSHHNFREVKQLNR